MKILENLSLNSEDIEVQTSKFRWIYNYNEYCLDEVNLETMQTVSVEISAPIDDNWYTCICYLPGNKSFCYRGNTMLDHICGIAFIIDEDHKIQVLPSKIITIGYCATFCNNYVYMFGEFCLFRYDLVKRRWEKIIAKLGLSNFCTCISINNMILVAWFDCEDIFIFDLRTCSFSSCPLELGQHSTKVLCRSENAAFLIDFSGLIRESSKNNFYSWAIIGSCMTFDFAIFSVKVFYKNSWYFNIDNAIMKFNLEKKTVKRTNASISYPID
ncbi:unnamed protein product [Blepharisma stoltei]|uniref:Uncharacterized protein n=1 Tax=Blepharisma stoltei TaxID=1481888 RepID=A0AAU9J3V9_9CILI|nr:unnamed protein product [Blepharisma stoltei]